MSRVAQRTRWCLAALLGAGCTEATAGTELPTETLRALQTAIDLDPGPGVVEIDLRAGPGVAEFTEGVPSSVLAYRDAAAPENVAIVPGPLIEATVGDRLIVHFENELPGMSTTVHWHGLRLPVQMDGNPMVSGVVDPGQGFEYDFVLRDAGLFWYHPHVDTDVQLELGLQGLLLVREAEPIEVDRDRVFALDDVALMADGAIDIDLEDQDAMLGRRGSVVTINGGPAGTIVGAPGSLERWRFVNTANGRYFTVDAGGVLSFRVVGWDGGRVSTPYDADELRIAPGERYDVLVQLPRGPEDIAVRTTAMVRGMVRGMDVVDDEAPLFELWVRGEEVQRTLPPLGVTIPRLDVTARPTRSFALTSSLDGPAGPAFFINDERWPLNTPVEVRTGDVDVWEVVNDEDHHHPFHIHGLFFQVLDPSFGQGATGWKDTVDIPPRSTTRLAVPYGGLGTWMFHCQIPEHAERGMMGDLVVVP